MARTVYLVVYNSPLFPAHWALWIPHSDDPAVGTKIHATGDANKGFETEIERNYDILATIRRHQILPLGEVSDQSVEDSRGSRTRSTEQIARDRLEQVVLSISAPGRSLNSSTSEGPRKKVEIQNCQTWIRSVVTALVQNGIMDEAALQVVDGAPKN